MFLESQQSQGSQHRTSAPSTPQQRCLGRGSKHPSPGPGCTSAGGRGFHMAPEPWELAGSCVIVACISGIRFNKQKLQVLQLHLNFRQKWVFVFCFLLV